jgi:hypothetical protein
VIAHVLGLPVEEAVLQLAPAGAATITALAIAGRASLGRLRQLRAAGPTPARGPSRTAIEPRAIRRKS